MVEVTHAADICQLADTVAELVMEKLSTSVVPSSFPAEIGEWIRETYKHGGRTYRHMIQMNGPTAMFADYTLNPDGTLGIQLADTCGCPFWRGTFRPAGEVPSHV